MKIVETGNVAYSRKFIVIAQRDFLISVPFSFSSSATELSTLLTFLESDITAKIQTTLNVDVRIAGYRRLEIIGVPENAMMFIEIKAISLSQCAS